MAQHRLWGGVAFAALLVATSASAQDNSAALEARIAQLEAELNALKAAVRENQSNQQVRTQALADDISRIQQASPAPVMAAAPPPTT